MSLTKIPKLTKKTWAETNLQNIIQDTKISKITINSKGKKTLAHTQTPSTKQTNIYVHKNKFSTIL